MVDTSPGDLAYLGTRALYGSSSRIPINMVMIGQSVTHGNVIAITAVATITGSTMTVSSLASGYQIEPGAEVDFPGVPAGTTVLALGTNGSTGIGQSGTYALSNSVTGTISGTMWVNIAQVFRSLRKPGVTVPLPGALSTSGGALFKLMDDLWDWGYDDRIINAARGSSSLITHWVGQIGLRSAGAGFFARRAAIGGADKGFAGVRISPAAPGSGPVWVATTGNLISAQSDTPNSVMVDSHGNMTNAASVYDFMQYSGTAVSGGVDFTATFAGTTMTVNTIIAGGNNLAPGQYLYGYGAAIASLIVGNQIVSQTSGTTGGIGVYVVSLSGQDGSKIVSASAANFNPSGQSPGAVQVDGGITWTMESLGNAAYGGGYGTVLTEFEVGHGFDPLGLVTTALDYLSRYGAQGAQTFVYIDGNQSDLSPLTTSSRQAAVVSAANYWLSRGKYVTVGNQIYSPGSGTLAQQITQNSANAAALTALQAATYGARAYAGADLTAVLGSTGPTMGGVTVTGSVSGNTLTVSSGAGITAGYNVWSGTNLVGVVASGSGTTWTLTGGVTTASGSLNIGGTYMQFDLIHTNQQGSIAQGAAYSAALKAILPQHATVN